MSTLILGGITREGFLEEVMCELPGNMRRHTAGWRGRGCNVQTPERAAVRVLRR